jgi:transcriptional regulator GlxA family with amidase domain
VVYGLQEGFSAVGTIWEQLTGEKSRARPMPPRIVARSTRMFRTTLGVPIAADRAFSDAGRSDIVIIADLALDALIDPRGQWPEATRWLREQYKRGATLCSVCTGAVMLAEAGLLDGQEVASHWSAEKLFSTRYPDVKLRTERVISLAGSDLRLVTSGGSASWSDLLLYLVARFNGQVEARHIAKIFLFGDRSEGQLPFAAMTRPSDHEDAVVADCQVWIAKNYELPNPVNRMVERSGLAQRTFKRRFTSATGYTPIDYVQKLRIEEAKQHLEVGDDPIDAIALKVGYEDPNSFRRLFRRSTGISPNKYRQRFQTVSMSANQR